MPPGRTAAASVIGNCFTANEPSWRPMGRLGMGRGVHTVRERLQQQDVTGLSGGPLCAEDDPAVDSACYAPPYAAPQARLDVVLEADGTRITDTNAPGMQPA